MTPTPEQVEAALRAAPGYAQGSHVDVLARALRAKTTELYVSEGFLREEKAQNERSISALREAEARTAESVARAMMLLSEKLVCPYCDKRASECYCDFVSDWKNAIGAEPFDWLARHDAEIVRPWREWAERVFEGRKHFAYCPGELPPPNTDCIDDRCKELRALLAPAPDAKEATK